VSILANWLSRHYLTAYLSILWVAVFGIFAKLFLHEDPEGDKGIQRMKNAIWVDLTNMLLWLVSGIMGAIVFFTSGKRTMWTGRATV
jgi:TctA family transporter